MFVFKLSFTSPFLIVALIRGGCFLHYILHLITPARVCWKRKRTNMLSCSMKDSGGEKRRKFAPTEAEKTKQHSSKPLNILGRTVFECATRDNGTHKFCSPHPGGGSGEATVRDANQTRDEREFHFIIRRRSARTRPF